MPHDSTNPRFVKKKNFLLNFLILTILKLIIKQQVNMAYKKLLCSILLLGLISPALSQNPAPPVATTPTVTPIVASGNKVDGIELPEDQTVKNDEGFITLQAKCTGEVKWLVVSAIKIKYFTLPQGNTIVVSIPPSGGLINVFAIGNVNGKLTEFARTNITIGGGTVTPVPKPGPVTPGPVVGGPFHVTFVADMNNVTNDLGIILNSQKVREAITSKNAFYRLYDASSPVLKEKGLDKVVAKWGGIPIMIVQDNGGAVKGQPTRIPKTEAEVLTYLNSVLGGQ